MAGWIDAFAPTFALIGLGIWLRAKLVRDPVVWAGLETLTFYVFLPALFVSSISTVDLGRLPLGAMAATLWTAIAVGFVSALALARALRHDHPAATSVVQGVIRYNSFVAFAIVGGLYGAPGLALGGVAAGLIVPIVQLLVTLAFTVGRGARFDPLGFARQLALNPLILGCLGGLAFALVGGLPPGLAPLGRSLGQASIAVGLLCVGAALVPASLRERQGTQALVGLAKLVVLPLVTFAAARALSLDPLPTAVAVMFMASPTAPTSYVQARAMGGDTRLMAATITLQHLAATITLPAWAWQLGP